MYSNILIATDLSRDSDEMVRCATGLYSLGCREAHLVYGLDVEEIGSVRDGLERFVKEYAPGRITLMHVQDRKRIEPHLANRLDEFNAKDHKRLTELHHRLALAAPTAHLSMEMPFGHPAPEILDYCRSESVSLVVMGTQGRGYVNEMFMGSVSHNVTRPASSPVFLIPVAAP